MLKPKYEKMYYKLFNAVTTALEQMENGNFADARKVLIKSQQDTEEMYISNSGIFKRRKD